MSGAQSVIVASGGIGAMVVLLLWVRRPWVHPRHAAPSGPAWNDELAKVRGDLREARLPVRTGCACGVQSGEHKLWCATADTALDWAARNELPPPGEWTDQLLADLHSPGQVPRGMTEPADYLEPGAGFLSPVTTATCSSADWPLKVDSPVPVDGAGDESEPSGVTAPPAPPCCDDPYGTHAVEAWAAGGFKVTWDGQPEPTRRASAVDVALAQMDAFMVGMRADHAQWMASARERWAAA